MQKLFIYYSHTGNGDLVAKKMAERGYEVRKVIEKAKMPKSFFFMIMAGGFRAGLGLKGKLIGYDDDVEGYEEIVIGSPIWNGRFPPATNEILARTELTGKKVSFLLYSGSGEGKHAAKKIAKRYPEAKVLFLKEPKKYPDEFAKLDAFLN